ncbi:MAG: undecaprenyl-diphosphate phosphatase [Chloroflexota bacterium]|jgi:undecaprenyl-diphosphatase|nr:undecaprenyl-diphosphate phosphatase [Chloroflexota bacterium]MDH5243523.1 undecaprenyl-diphosphate phosphatase [Chloroflexota bacterium]
MDPLLQALIMGIVQGLTEFLPVSSSGHLILVPYLFGWDDAFINSLAFSVMLHLGTLVALLGYFRRDWVRLVPAGLAAIRDRSFRGDADRKLAWLLAAATVPAALVGYFLSDIIETQVREVELVAVMFVVGAAILWTADHVGARTKDVGDVSFPVAIGIGAAQALALVPGISRSGISISAARFAGLDRPAAARFAFLMATPITLGAIVFEARKIATGEAAVTVEAGPLFVGLLASLVSGVLAIHFMLRYLRTRSLDIFVWYRLGVAALMLVVVLTR